PSCVRHDSVLHFHSKLLVHYFIMTTAMTLRRLGCALCMPFISPFRSPFWPYKRAYAYRGLTAFAPLSMAISERVFPSALEWLPHREGP
ncbi:MAG: hypothetical protein KZQ60_09760, partial [Candidatus Thiodiazotropha sp. (ex Lucinoma aequizonata)]|nr:hypothetical protein [Candidatus Thiodiazotropha sp. (ex Lucinoma aequizonata)]